MAGPMSRSSSQLQRNGHRKRKRTVISCTECHRRKQKCDRHYPCCNCVRRDKQDLCQYNSMPASCQPEPSSPHNNDPSETSDNNNTVHLVSPARSGSERVDSGIQGSLQGFGYSSHDNYNSKSLLRAIEFYRDPNNNWTDSHSVDKPTVQNDAQHRYTELIRRLPPQVFVDILIQTFFTIVNWQYDLLDDEIFREQLKAWGKVSYSNLQDNLEAITPELLVFPALLLQMLAQALLVHSPHDKTINGLMIMADMTLHDLAAQYSNAGSDILLLLGKRCITTTTVQAGLLRASFLKNRGQVVDAWHTLGATIRDAQEIGLHTGRNEHKQRLSDSEGEKQFLNAVGAKIWVVLHIWDAHMAVVLGRPMATNLDLENFTQTIGDDEGCREMFWHWQTENEPPRPFDIIIAGYIVAYRYFQDIHHLEHYGAKPRDNLTVEHIHAMIMSNLELLPSWCRLENPSTRYDKAHGCQWLPAARQVLHSLIHLVLLTLHRPHIFSKTDSRMQALKSGRSILCAQEKLFQQSEPHQRNLFTPVYASFDAIVLISAIYLAFPNENRERQVECVQAVERGIHRLDIVGRSNSMARSAHGVALGLYGRLLHRLDALERGRNTFSSSEQISPGGYKNSSNLALSELSFDTVSPPRPIHDLFYDHLSTAQISISGTPTDTLAVDSFTESITDNWNFEGVFSDDSFWGVLNEFDSYT